MSADGLIQEIRRHGANVSVEDGELYRDPQTGDLVPRRLAMATPSPEAEFTAQLSRFNSRSIAQEVDLVDI
jgi:hypothetical protein